MKNVNGFLYLAAVQLALVFALHLARRKFPVSLTREQQNTFIGPFSFVVTVYAFLLGFVVVNLWQTFTEAERSASKEAETLFIVQGLFSQYGARDGEAAVQEFAGSIVREEWPAMAEGKTSPATQEKRVRVMAEFRKLSPSSAKEQAIYSELIAQIGNAFQLRQDRLMTSSGTGSMPDVMWVALGYGGLMVLAGLYYLGVGNQREQTVIDFIVTGILFVTVFLIIQFDSPFQGRLRVKPQAFERIAAQAAPAPPAR